MTPTMSELFKEAVLIQSPSFGPKAGDACAVTLLSLQTLQISVAEHVSLQKRKKQQADVCCDALQLYLNKVGMHTWKWPPLGISGSIQRTSSASLWDFFKRRTLMHHEAIYPWNPDAARISRGFNETVLSYVVTVSLCWWCHLSLSLGLLVYIYNEQWLPNIPKKW